MRLISRFREWRDTRKRKALADYMATLEGLTIDLQNGRISADATFGGPPVRLFAAGMVAWFREIGAQSFVACELHCSKTGERYEVTMQRAGGKTPCQRIAELERQVADLQP